MFRCSAAISLLSAVLSISLAESWQTSKKIVWEDCGGDAASVRFRSFEMSLPKIPGPLHFYLDAEADEPLETIALESRFSWELWWFGGPMEIPCVKNFGSCVYDDICGILSRFKRDNGNACPQQMQNVGLVDNCTCPMQPGRAKGYFSINLPAFPREVQHVKSGKWTIELSLQNQANQEVGCASCSIDWDNLDDGN